ncbi:hypothetical protein EIP86_007353 [Pleurotus ostreatoroseus]|nr:hypothetical protein EIP86_007353 [Pleurotus ostreatoroseus]
MHVWPTNGSTTQTIAVTAAESESRKGSGGLLKDPDRTEAMKKKELDLIFKVGILSLKYCSLDGGASDIFVDRVQELIDEELLEVHEYLEQEENPAYEVLHEYRRRIAILHEEMDLQVQGSDSHIHATMLCHMVSYGRGYVQHRRLFLTQCLVHSSRLLRVNKTVFKKVYGF